MKPALAMSDLAGMIEAMSRTDSASLLVHADPARIFAVMVDPDALARWLPPEGMSGRFEHFDARPGGSYRLVLSHQAPGHGRGKSTPDSDVVDARFVELVSDQRVVQEIDFDSDDPDFHGTMTMSWELARAGDATRVTIRADGVPLGISAEAHAVGLGSSLANLAAYVEAGD